MWRRFAVSNTPSEPETKMKVVEKEVLVLLFLYQNHLSEKVMLERAARYLKASN
jgi:hypothetical protein